jgi:hypothetical protein
VEVEVEVKAQAVERRLNSRTENCRSCPRYHNNGTTGLKMMSRGIGMHKQVIHPMCIILFG